MQSTNTPEGVLPYVLLGMTAVTGLIDAVSFLALGHVFTANMTGNIEEVQKIVVPGLQRGFEAGLRPVSALAEVRSQASVLALLRLPRLSRWRALPGYTFLAIR